VSGFQFERECRTPQSESYIVELDEEGPVDIHYTASVACDGDTRRRSHQPWPTSSSSLPRTGGGRPDGPSGGEGTTPAA
jgi:hypothetical protein